MDDKYVPIEEMEMLSTFVEIAEAIWNSVQTWDSLSRETVGKQIIRAADSIGANLVEGDGRYSVSDTVHFFVIARASARETCYWINRSETRSLMSADFAIDLVGKLNEATRQLNGVIKYRSNLKSSGVLKDNSADYQCDLEQT